MILLLPKWYYIILSLKYKPFNHNGDIIMASKDRKFIKLEYYVFHEDRNITENDMNRIAARFIEMIEANDLMCDGTCTIVNDELEENI